MRIKIKDKERNRLSKERGLFKVERQQERRNKRARKAFQGAVV